MSAGHSHCSIIKDLWTLQSETLELLGHVRGLIGALARQEMSGSVDSEPVMHLETVGKLAATLDQLRCKLVHGETKRAAFEVLSAVPEFASETARAREEHSALEVAFDDVIKLASCSGVPGLPTLAEIKSRCQQIPSRVSGHLNLFIDLVRRAMISAACKVEPAGAP